MQKLSLNGSWKMRELNGKHSAPANRSRFCNVYFISRMIGLKILSD